MTISIHAPRGGSDLAHETKHLLISDFNPRSPWGERPGAFGATLDALDFNPRSPWGERPALFSPKPAKTVISIHAPRGGSDTADGELGGRRNNFNPRSPWGERLHWATIMVFFSPISIHAPRGGSDRCGSVSRCPRVDFNPRSPWGERLRRLQRKYDAVKFQSTLPVGGATFKGTDKHIVFPFQSTLPVGGATEPDNPACDPSKFQSTLPVGGATVKSRYHRIVHKDFNPRSPWGERQVKTGTAEEIGKISIHAPRGGSDGGHAFPAYLPHISIHAPRGGSDDSTPQHRQTGRNFNPRSPWGERPILFMIRISSGIFQSTLPVGGATEAHLPGNAFPGISIHAPRGGSDRAIPTICAQ